MTNSNSSSGAAQTICNCNNRVSIILNWICFSCFLFLYFVFFNSYTFTSLLTFLGIMDVTVFFTLAVFAPVSLLCDAVALFYIILNYEKENFIPTAIYIILFSILI